MKMCIMVRGGPVDIEGRPASPWSRDIGVEP